MYCLLHPCFQKGLRLVLNIWLRYGLLFLGIIALLHFFGAFTHLFEITYNKDFVYPYEGDVHEFASALRHDERPAVAPINEYNYTYILHNPQKCVEAGYSTFCVVYVVKSAIEHFDRRTAIRNSWGFEKRFFDVPSRTLFLIGTHPGDVELQARLKAEASKYKDIVQADFVDTYYNNTIKTMMGFKWIAKYCPNSKFYMFVDDDMYVSVKNVLKFIRNPASYPDYLKEPKKIVAHKREIKRSDLVDYRVDVDRFNDTVYDPRIPLENPGVREANRLDPKESVDNERAGDLGNDRSRGSNATSSSRTKRQVFDFELPDDIRLFAGFVFVSSPHRHRSSKWYVSLKEYPYHLWPPYVTAGAYILSKEAFLDMFYTSFYTKHFRFDDIFLGLVAKKADIEPFHCEEFHFDKKAYTRFNYKYVITSHGYGDPNELLQVWNEQKALGNA